MQGQPHEVIKEYLHQYGQDMGNKREWVREEAPGNDLVKVLKVHFYTPNAVKADTIEVQGDMVMDMEFVLEETRNRVDASIHIFNEKWASGFKKHLLEGRQAESLLRPPAIPESFLRISRGSAESLPRVSWKCLESLWRASWELPETFLKHSSEPVESF